MNIHEILLSVKGDASDAKEELRDIAARLTETGRIKAEARLGLDGVEGAEEDILSLQRMLVELAAMNPSPEVNLQIAGAMVASRLMGRELERLDRSSNTVRAGFNTLTSAVSGLASVLSPDRVGIGPFSFGLSGLGVIGGAVAVTIAGALVGAVAALTASLAAALLAVLALATAFGGVLGPAIGAVAAVFLRYNQATEDQEEAEKRLTAATQRAEQAASRHAAAVQQQKAAVDAVRAARERYRQSLQSERIAEQNLSSAQRAQRAAQQALTLARADAERQLVDLRLAATDSALSERRAALTLAQSRQNLARVERQGRSSALELADARLAVQEAEAALQNAQVQSGRSRVDLNSAEAKGIERSDAVVGARRDLGDAERAVEDAARGTRDAQRGSRQAAANLRVESRELAGAQDLAARSAGALSLAQGRQKDAAKKADQATGGLVGRVDALKQGFLSLLPIVDPFLNALIAGATQVQGIFASLGPALGVFARAAAQATSLFVALLATPGALQAFNDLIVAGAAALGPLAQIMANFGLILTNIARDAMPFLVQLLQEFAGWLTVITGQTTSAGALSETIGTLVTHLRAWLGFARALSNVFLAFMDAAAPSGRSLVDTLTAAADAFAAFLRSTEGQERVRQFFDETIPLAVKLGETLLTQVIPLLLQISEALAPAVIGALKALDIFLKVLNFLIGVFNTFGSALKEVIFFLVSFFVLGGKFGLVAKVARLAFAAISTAVIFLIGHLGDLISIIGKALAFIPKAFAAIGKALWKAGSFMGRTLFELLTKFKGTFTSILNFLKSIPMKMFQVAYNIGRGIVRGVASVIGRVVSLVVGVFVDIFRFLASIPGRLFNMGKAVIQGLIDGIKSMASAVAQAVSDVVSFIPNTIGGVLGISSPSKVTMKLGEDVSRGFAIGIDRAAKNALRSATSLAEGAQMGIGGHALAGAAGGGGRQIRQNITVPITVPGGGSPDETVLGARLERKLRRKGQTLSQ